MKKHLLYFTILLNCLFYSQSWGQMYSEETLRIKLDSVSLKHPGYNNTVQLNVTGLPLSELVNTVALENNLNISIDPALNQVVSYNFFDAQVKDILVFLYDNFDVEFQFVGSILSITQRFRPKEVIVVPEKKVDVKYNPSNQFLSVDLKNDSLFKVVKEMTSATGKNIVLSPDVRDKPVSAYFLNRPFEQVLDMLAKANGLEYKADENGVHYIYLPAKTVDNRGNSSNGFKPTTLSEQTGVRLTRNQFGTLDISANNAELSDIVQLAAQEIGAPYFLYNKPEGKSTFNIINVTFPELLDFIFNGTKYAYHEENKVYLIGETKTEGIRATELIRMENRTIENVKTAIPKDMIADLDITEFLELNGLVISGPQRKIAELRQFLSSIDVVVPMVQIDVMILTSERSHTTKTGIKAGLGKQPTVTSGTVFPTVDVNLGAQSINAILDGINGFGIVNLGNVTQNFYLSLQMLETNGIIDVESTPKVTTLSGHQATVSIGQTTYYQEQVVDVQNSVVNQGVLTSKTWKSVDANLTVKIKPFVSSDGNVTMTVTVTNDDFDGSKVDPTAPPNITKQTFESVIRVQNSEVVLLGGLDKKQNNSSGEGVPLLSRIPVIKWLFSSRSKSKRKYKMHIIIRPTITY